MIYQIYVCPTNSSVQVSNTLKSLFYCMLHNELLNNKYLVTCKDVGKITGCSNILSSLHNKNICQYNKIFLQEAQKNNAITYFAFEHYIINIHMLLLCHYQTLSLKKLLKEVICRFTVLQNEFYLPQLSLRYSKIT